MPLFIKFRENNWRSVIFYCSDKAAIVGSWSLFSSSSVVSWIVARLDTQDSFRLRNIGLILEAEFDLLAFDLVVVELAFLVPLLDLSEVLAFNVLLSSDVPEFVFLLAKHGDVAGDRSLSVALGVPKLGW